MRVLRKSSGHKREIKCEAARKQNGKAWFNNFNLYLDVKLYIYHRDL